MCHCPAADWRGCEGAERLKQSPVKRSSRIEKISFAYLEIAASPLGLDTSREEHAGLLDRRRLLAMTAGTLFTTPRQSLAVIDADMPLCVRADQTLSLESHHHLVDAFARSPH